MIKQGEKRELAVLHLIYLRFWSAIAWHALGMARALQQRGHTCWIAGAPQSPVLNRASGMPALMDRTVALPWLRPWNWLSTIDRLRKTIQEQSIDLIFVHTGSGHLEAHLARLGLGTGIVRVRADARKPRLDPGKRWLYRHGTDRIAVSGAYLAQQYLGAGGFDSERICHLPPGIDFETIATDPALARNAAAREIRHRYSIPSETSLLGIIGRLSPVKGHLTLIKALALVDSGALGADFRLLVVGAEKETRVAELRQAASACGISERLIFTGHVDDPLLHSAALDIGVISSHGSEAVSRSALEFMATGVPVVASAVGILPEVVGDPSRIVPPGDAPALAAALTALLERPEWARQCGESGRARARNEYSFAALGQRTEAVALAALANRRGTAEGGQGLP